MAKEIKFSSLERILKKLHMSQLVDLTESVRETYQLDPGAIIDIDGTTVYIDGKYKGKLYMAMEESIL